MSLQTKFNFDPLQFGWKPLLAALALLVTGWMLTAWSVHKAWQDQRENAQEEFQLLANRVERGVGTYFESPIRGMRGAAGAMAATGDMRRHQFKAYVGSRNIAAEFPGTQSFTYVERVMRPDVPRFEAAQHADSATGFTVNSRASAPELYVVKFVEPSLGNQAALGRDLGAEPVYLEAIERAIDNGRPSLSGLSTLAQDQGNKPGFVLLLPVFATAEVPATPEDRRILLRGFMGATVTTEDLLAIALTATQDGIDFELFDGIRATPQNLAFSSLNTSIEADGQITPTDFKADRALHAEVGLVVGERFLLLRMGSKPDLERELASNAPLLIGLGGAVSSLLLASFIWLLLAGRMRAEGMARDTTQDLDHLLAVQVSNNNKLMQAQRENEALMQAINQHALVSIADPSGRITHANALFCQTSGYSRDELLGQNHRILKSAAQPDEFWTNMWQTIAAGRVWRNVVCNQAKDGTLYWVDTLISPFFNDQGVDKYVAIRTDITDTVLARQALDAERGRLDNIITGTNTGTWEWNISTGELIINERWAEILGYAVQELRPATVQTWSDRCHPDDLAATNQKRQLHLDGGLDYYDSEFRMKHRDGHWVWIHAAGKISSWTSGGVPAWMSGTHMDISAQKQAQAQLSEQLQFVEVLLEATPVAIYIKDRQGHYLRFNKAFEDVFGIQRTGWLGKTVFDLVPHDLALAMDEKDQGLYAEGGLQAYESQFVRHDNGETRLGAYRKAVLHNQDGEVVGLVGAIQDVTERNRIAHELREAMQAVQAATVAKSQFLANMSHEIRTPMNAIMGLLSLLQSTDQTAQQMDYTGKTLGAAKSLLGILNDILDFSKIDAGKMTLDPQPFGVDTLLRDLSVILSASTGNKSLEVLFDADPNVPTTLLGDAMRLQQVLTNLASNAIKFTAQGEVRVQIRLLARDPSGCRLRFAVCDTGIGISAENQLHIFDGFSQAEASTTRRFGGTGLGLTISRQLVALMGGELAINSVPGQGSTFHFTITLPEATPLESAQEASQRLAGRIPAQFQVLVVDDYPAARDIHAALAKSLGWQVDAVSTGTEALAQVTARAAAGHPPYQAVLVDWQMPDMDGWETIRRIRDLTPPKATTPIMLMVTTMGREMLSQRTPQEQASLHSFLVKPVTALMLRDHVLDALAGRSNIRSRSRSRPDRAQPLKGMRLLVVEDNLINQQVARELLTNEGALVEIAGNGQLGVAAVANASLAFDAVLMDLQMPVMDGFAATQAIRHELGLTQLPIIAMTANAMASDREACLAAGMNDHIGKPFDLQQLIQLLSRLVSQPPSTPVQWPASTPRQQAADPDAIDQALERLGGNRALYSRTLDAYLAELSQLPSQLGTLLQAGDWAEATRLLHTTKGLSATVGASALAEVARKAEIQLKAADTTDGTFMPGDLHADFSLAVASTQVHMRTLCEQLKAALPPDHTPAPSAPPHNSTLVADLQRLRALLEASDMQALEVHARLHQTHASAVDPALAPLAASIAAFDFSQAVVQCKALVCQFSPSI
jgi:PAS domain S-box-containing protein